VVSRSVGFSSATTRAPRGFEVLHEPLDGAALASGVAALEHDDVSQAVRLAPLLQLQQFDLQQPLLLLVLLALHSLVVRIVLAPGVDDLAAGLDDQLGVVVIVVAHRVAVQGRNVESHRRNVSTPAKSSVTDG
jgi:hypothetical protein